MTFFKRLLPAGDLLRMPLLRWLVIARFFGDLYFYSTTLVLFQRQRGLNFTEMFLMEAVLSAAIWLADVPTSIWAEQIGYARMMLIGRTIGLVGMIVFASAHGFWLFVFAEILGGTAIAASSGCESALVYTSLPSQQRSTRGGDAFALLTSAASAGLFLGLFTGSFLGAYSPTLAVLASIIPSLLACIATFRLTRYAPVVITREHKEQTRIGTILRVAWSTLWAQPRLAFLSLFRSLAFALTNSIFWYNQPYFERVGIPIVLWGPFMAAAMGAQLLILLRVPTFKRLLGTRLMLVCSCLLPGLCYMLLAWSYMPALSVLLVAGVVSFSAWQQPVVEQELNSRIADSSRATTLSTLTLIGSLAKGMLDPFIGRLGDAGLDMVGVGLGAGLILLGALTPLLIARERVS